MPTPQPKRTLRVCALYPDLMNIYADRGNLLVLERRCAWRGIGFELSPCGLGERFDAGAHDLFYLGGGQDRDQRLCAEDLIETKSAALHAAAARGAVVLGVCGGFQLLGHNYTLGGEQIEGVGLLDVATLRGKGPRLIGNIAIELSPGASAGEEREGRVLAGFENHGGRTTLGEREEPLGRRRTRAAARRSFWWRRPAPSPAARCSCPRRPSAARDSQRSGRRTCTWP